MSGRARAFVITAGLGLVLFAAWWTMAGSDRPAEAPKGRDRDAAPGEPTRVQTSSRGGDEPGVARTLAPDAPRIVGRVIDAEDGPLAEGSVVLGCPDGTALGRAAIDEEGWFEAEACPSSTTCVRLIHPGSVQTRAWQLDAGETVELEVEAAPRIAGTVLARGEAVADARVIARRGDHRWTAGTDIEGGFSLALAEPPDDESACDFEPRVDDRSFALLVQAPGHRPWTATIPATGDDALTIHLAQPAAPLSGRLEDGEGRHFDRARVLATSRDRPDEAHAAHPDAEGRFEFGELGEGTYDLRAVRDGIELIRGEGEAGANVVMVGTLSARGPTLELRVHDDRGEPLAGVRVDGGPFRAAHTDAAGIVTATDVFAAAYELRMRAPEFACGVARERVEVPEGEHGRRIRVDLSLACEGDDSPSGL